MARKRLYGETQKRRKKKQTQALKRQSSVTRVQSTHKLAPFQRSGEVSPQDVAFMEAMLDMGVKRYPRSGEAPVAERCLGDSERAAHRPPRRITKLQLVSSPPETRVVTARHAYQPSVCTSLTRARSTVAASRPPLRR